MNSFSEYIGSQFGNPHGIIGMICCFIMNRINRPMYDRTVELLKLGPENRVLDIGYGNGYLLNSVYRKTGAELHGIDISEDMRKRADKRNRAARNDRKLFLKVGDCCNLCYEDEYFHAVTSINTVYFWSDTAKGLSEIRRTLKTGCSFYNVAYSKEFLDSLRYTEKGFKKFEPEELAELGRQAGFNTISVQDIVKGKSFVVIYTK